MAELFKPEISNSRQHFAFARDRVRQDDVEGREAVSGDDQQLVGIDGVDVADFTFVKQLQAGDGGFEKRSGHGRFPESKREGL